jgi:hypothetical protein
MNTKKLRLPRIKAKPIKKLGNALPSIRETRDEINSTVSESRSSIISSDSCNTIDLIQSESTANYPGSPMSGNDCDVSPAAKSLSKRKILTASSIERRAIQAKKICISPNYKGKTPAFMMAPENSNNRRSLNFASAESIEDKKDIMLARETRVDQVKAEIARIEARKKRYHK